MHCWAWCSFGLRKNSLSLSVLTSIFLVNLSFFPFSASTLLDGRQEGHPACKKPGVGLLVTIWLELFTSYSFNCHHHLHHSSSKIQNGVILMPAYPDHCENWPINEFCHCSRLRWDYYILYSELLKLWRCRLQIPLPTCLSRNLQMVRRWWFKLLQHLVNMPHP